MCKVLLIEDLSLIAHFRPKCQGLRSSWTKVPRSAIVLEIYPNLYGICGNLLITLQDLHVQLHLHQALLCVVPSHLHLGEALVYAEELTNRAANSCPGRWRTIIEVNLQECGHLV